jgi:hypothetical protein
MQVPVWRPEAPDVVSGRLCGDGCGHLPHYLSVGRNARSSSEAYECRGGRVGRGCTTLTRSAVLEYQADSFEDAQMLVNGRLFAAERPGQLTGRQRSHCREPIDDLVPNRADQCTQLTARQNPMHRSCHTGTPIRWGDCERLRTARKPNANCPPAGGVGGDGSRCSRGVKSFRESHLSFMAARAPWRLSAAGQSDAVRGLFAFASALVLDRVVRAEQGLECRRKPARTSSTPPRTQPPPRP